MLMLPGVFISLENSQLCGTELGDIWMSVSPGRASLPCWAGSVHGHLFMAILSGKGLEKVIHFGFIFLSHGYLQPETHVKI